MEVSTPPKGLIALFLPSLRGGGAERVMVNLARGFCERGLSVDFVLGKAEGPFLSEVPKGVRVFDLGAKRVLYALPGLVRYLRQERPDALLSTLAHANVVAIWACALGRVPVRLIVREVIALTPSASNAENLRERIMPILIRLFYRYADAIVANARWAADDLVIRWALPREKIKVIYNPINVPEILAKAEEPLNHPWFQVGEPPVILGVGRLTKQKDFPTLIRAFALVRKKISTRLVIAGEGREQAKLEALVQELGLEKDVALLGFVENPYRFMKRAAVFALSSRWEGLPTVLIEALILGVPIVATNCPSGPAEILEEGRWGQLVQVGDWEGMASAIERALKIKPTVEEIEMRRSIAQSRFGLHKITEEYLNVIYES